MTITHRHRVTQITTLEELCAFLIQTWFLEG